MYGELVVNLEVCILGLYWYLHTLHLPVQICKPIFILYIYLPNIKLI